MTVQFQPGFRLIDGTDLNSMQANPSGDIATYDTVVATVANTTTENVTNLNAGTVVVSGLVTDSVQNSITASATQTLAGAVALTKGICIVTTVGTAGDAVKLAPAAAAGQQQLVINNGASAMAVFPFEAGTKIDGGSAGASVTLTNGKNATFYQDTTATWISIQGGAKAS